MRIRNNLLLFFTITLFAIACKKETIYPVNSILAGNTEDLMAYSGDINHKLTTLGLRMNSFSLDMDHNGFNDLKFVVENYDGVNTISQRINIIPISKSVYISYQNIDELYCKHTNITGDTTWNELYDSTQTYDSIISIYNNHDIRHRIYAEGSQISLNDASYNDEMQIAYVFKQFNSSDNNSYMYSEWIGQKNKYIGIKIINNNATYIGWIKVEVLDYDEIYIGNYYLKQVRS